MAVKENGRRARRPPRSGPARRAFDVVAASTLAVVTLPLLVAGVLLVWLEGGRPIFFGHVRLGRGGRPFRCWKLRTMAVDAEAWLERDPGLRQRHGDNGFKLPASSDPRVTRVGRWLRRTYIDELPQLYNVIRGDMSFLGPRPIVQAELDLFGEEAERLLDVRPGVFGAWNSLGRARPPYPERARVELDYVERRTLGRDLRILGRSVIAVLQGEADE